MTADPRRRRPGHRQDSRVDRTDRLFGKGRRACPPSRLLAVTFTNKAARELRERMTALIGPPRADSITMGTFHSLCLAILRVDIGKLPEPFAYRRGFAVYDEHYSLKLIQKIKARIEGSSAAVKTADQQKRDDFSAAAVQSIISAAKNEGYDSETFRATPPSQLVLPQLRQLGSEELKLVGRVFAEYEKTMRAENIIDFDDMLILATTVLRTCERTRRKYARHWLHVLVGAEDAQSGPMPRAECKCRPAATLQARPPPPPPLLKDSPRAPSPDPQILDPRSSTLIQTNSRTPMVCNTSCSLF